MNFSVRVRSSRRPSQNHRRLEAWLLLLLTNQVPAAARSHPRGMDGACGNIAAFARAIGLRRAAVRQRHFAVEDDVRCFGRRAYGQDKTRSVRPARRRCEEILPREAGVPVILDPRLIFLCHAN